MPKRIYIEEIGKTVEIDDGLTDSQIDELVSKEIIPSFKAQPKAEGEGLVSQILHAPRDIGEWLKRGGGEAALNAGALGLTESGAAIADILLPMTGVGEKIRSGSETYARQMDEATRRTEGFGEMLGPSVVKETAGMAPKLALDTVIGGLLPGSQATKFGQALKSISPTLKGMFISDMENIYTSDKPLADKAQEAIKTTNNLLLLDRMGKILDNPTTKSAVLKAAQANPALRAALGVLGFGVVGEAGALQEGRLMTKEEAIKTLAMAIPFEAPHLLKKAPLSVEETTKTKPVEPTKEVPVEKPVALEERYAQKLIEKPELSEAEALAEAKAEMEVEVPKGEPSTGQVPVMITKDMRQQLYDQGFSKAEVDSMTPQDAWSVLEPSTKKATQEPTMERPQPTPIEEELKTIRNETNEAIKKVIEKRKELREDAKLKLTNQFKKGEITQEEVTKKYLAIERHNEGWARTELRRLWNEGEAREQRAVKGRNVEPIDLAGEFEAQVETPIEQRVRAVAEEPVDAERLFDEMRVTKESVLPTEETVPNIKDRILKRMADTKKEQQLTPEEIRQVDEAIRGRTEAEPPGQPDNLLVAQGVTPINPFPQSVIQEMVYHGTPTKFDKFDKKFTGGLGFYFTRKESGARMWAGEHFHTGKMPKESEVKKVFVNITNPAPLDVVKQAYDEAKGGNPRKQAQEKLQSMGYDGFVRQGEGGDIVVFSPQQIIEVKELPSIEPPAPKTMRGKKLQAKLAQAEAEAIAEAKQITKQGGKISAKEKAKLREQGMSEEDINNLELRRTGPSPEIIIAWGKVGAIKVIRGAVDFAVWSESMVRDFGEQIRPHLQNLWNEAQAKATEWKKLPEEGKDLRGFFANVVSSEKATPELKMKIVQEYDPVRPILENKKTVAEAEKALSKNPDSVRESVLSDDPVSAKKSASAILLMKHYESQGNYDAAYDVFKSYSEQLTAAGQFIQAARLMNTLDPQTVVRMAVKLGQKYKHEFSEAEQKRIYKEFSEINKMPSGAERDARLLRELNRLADQLPLTFGEKFDAYRYQNMLSGVRTQQRNIYGNTFQVFVTRPLDMLGESGGATKIPAYYQHTIAALPKAMSAAIQRFKEGTINAKILDVAQARGGMSALEALRMKKMPGYLTVVGRAMEAQDRFFSTLIAEGKRIELEAKGVSPEEAAAQGNALGEKYMFRERVGKANPDDPYFVRALDSLGKTAMDMRKLPALSKPASWFIPFVTTPVNIAKQMVERSPLGFVGGKMGREQIAKATTGTMITAAGAMLAAAGRTTWTAPSDDTAKQQFYAAKRRPYSIKIGNTWVPMLYFGPYGLALAIPAAFRHYQEDDKAAIKGSELKQVGRAIQNMSKFLMSQTSLTGMTNFLQAIGGEGDYNFPAAMGFTAGQVIPLNALIRYVNNWLDPIYRKAPGFKEAMMRDLPGLSKQLEAYTTPEGLPSKRDAVSTALPYDVGKAVPRYEAQYQRKVKEIQAKTAAREKQKKIEQWMQKQREKYAERY